MIKTLKIILNMIFCKHIYSIFSRNIYGDEINFHNGKRSEWFCKKCGCVGYKNELHFM